MSNHKLLRRATFGDDYTPPTPTNVPKPVSYHVYVRPKPARQQIGSIALAKRTQNAEMATRTMGQVVGIGDLAWKLKTPDMDPTQDTVAQSIAVGTWVHYRQHAGQKLKVRKPADATSEFDENSNDYILILADTDILGVFEDEAHADSFLDWV
jgi:hypothetical protein